MTEPIIGVDISKWQSKLTQAQVDKLKSQGVRFAYVRFSQGGGYKDPVAKDNTALLQANKILVGPYHFTTKDNPLQQYDNFVGAMGDIQFDLPPALDCEAYQESYSTYGYMMADDEVLELREIPLTLSYTTESIVDVIGTKLKKEWMISQSKLAQFPEPAIYTNPSSGNIIFKSSKMGRYLLWVAHWGVSKPIMPNVWKGQNYFIWQDRVIKGAQDWSIDGDLDHDVWGTLMEFPNYTPDPPTPEPTEDWIQLELTFPDGSKWSGKVNKEV